MRQSRLVPKLVLASLVGCLHQGCSSGSGKKEGVPAEACSVSRELPADQSRAYAPLAVGNRWVYRATQSLSSRFYPDQVTEFQQSLKVTGTKGIDGTQAFVVSDLNHKSSMTEEYLEVTPGGLVNHGAGPFSYWPGEVAGAPAFVELPFPIRVCSTVDQFNASVDGVTVKSSAVARALETSSVVAGVFQDSLRLERTLVFSQDKGGKIPEYKKIDIVDWFAPGLGRIKRTVDAEGGPYSKETYELTGALVDGVGRGVIPFETAVPYAAKLPGTFRDAAIRPVVAFDGTRFFAVERTIKEPMSGGLRGTFLGKDGAALSAFQIIDDIGEPVEFDVAYGDGRYLVVYQLMNGSFYGLLLSADGKPTGNPFKISNWTQALSVVYGAGVFLVAQTSSGSVWLTPITKEGEQLEVSQPYPGQNPTSLAMAFDGTNFLVAWQRKASDGSIQVEAGRVDPQGRAIDVNPASIARASGIDDGLDMAFDGTNYVIAWNYVPVTSKTKEGTVRIARVTKDGVSLDGSASDVGGRAVSKTSTLGANPRIGRVGSQTMVVWEITSDFDTWLVGTRLDVNGAALDTSNGEEGIWVSAQPAEGFSSFHMPEIAYGGDVSLVVYIAPQSDGVYKLQDTLIYPW